MVGWGLCQAVLKWWLVMSSSASKSSSNGGGDSSLPKEPTRNPPIGYHVIPPFRVQGISIAGEESVVQIPELDVCFDIGRCPRLALASPYVALTHGHMDHAAGIAYYYSQRQFQGMGTGTILCPKALEQPIHNLMRAWVDIEAQKTPYQLVGMNPDDEVEVKNHIFLRAFPTIHPVPSLGFVLVEKRSKLKPELLGLPQEQLLAMKASGREITQMHEFPLIAYTGDTMWGPHFGREDVLHASILITECTFLEKGHRDRAAIGQHLHMDDILKLLEMSRAKTIVLTHLSRRTHMSEARKEIDAAIPAQHRSRIVLLMDTRSGSSSRTPRG